MLLSPLLVISRQYASSDLVRNGFSVEAEHNILNGCVIAQVKKLICDDEMIVALYKFNSIDSYEKFPAWCREMITAHRIIGVEEVR